MNQLARTPPTRDAEFSNLSEAAHRHDTTIATVAKRARRAGLQVFIDPLDQRQRLVRTAEIDSLFTRKRVLAREVLERR